MQYLIVIRRCYVSTKTIHKSKKWLDPNTTSFIFTEIEFDYSWGAQLKMGDCNRIVNYDVYIDSPKARKRTVRKLNIMIEEIMELKDQIEEITYGG